MAQANDYQVGGNHYRVNAIQHWDYVLANGIPYLEAQVIKYVTRWRLKNGVQDLQKAQHYLQKLIEHEAKRAEASAVAMARKTAESILGFGEREHTCGVADATQGYVNQDREIESVGRRPMVATQGEPYPSPKVF